MEIELLVVPDCPNEAAAYELANAARDGLDISVTITTTIIATDADAQRRGFVGSPTFLLNGQDPFARPGSQVGLACRLYPTPAGPAGVPPLNDLRDALRSQSEPQPR